MAWKRALSAAGGTLGLALLPLGFVVLDLLDRSCSAPMVRWTIGLSVAAFVGNLALLLVIPVVCSGEGPDTGLPRLLGLLGTLGFGVILIAGAPAIARRQQDALFRSLRDLRDIGRALDARRAAGHPPGVGAPGEIAPGELARLLVPTFLAEVPAADGWGSPYVCRLEPDGRYLLLSPGKCGERDLPEPNYAEGSRPSPFKSDLVFADGHFVQVPRAADREAARLEREGGGR